MVLIAQDGVQRPPIRFPTTGSLMRFLECLETGLVPYGRLDPPLTNESGSGTLFGKPVSRGTIAKPSLSRNYVFRLVPSIKPEDIGESWSSCSIILSFNFICRIPHGHYIGRFCRQNDNH